MYLSALSRASREAMESFAVADFDSVPVALWAKPDRDTVQQQNDLRRICCYAVWRKPHMRAVSYFILRFFHGYRIQEIAEIACVPLDAIQRRLSEARAEVRAHLAEPYKTPSLLSTAPPEPVQCWSPVSSQSLIEELRASILSSRTGECLSESELRSHYRSIVPKPVATARLSHIVSCEQCLARIDEIGRRPTLKRREPLDGIDGFDGGWSENGGGGPVSDHHSMLRIAQKHRDDVYDHRPQTISIAVDGKIAALHEVQAQRNMQSARIERADKASFVEVFSEQGLRLAKLSLDELPPNGPHRQVQRTNLSDGRWIDLNLTIDGQGLNAEAVYVDPALPTVYVPARSEEEDRRSPVLLEFGSAARDGAENAPAKTSGKDPVRPGTGNSEAKSGPLLVRLWPRLSEIPAAMNPLLTSAMILGLASILCFVAWMHRAPSVTANALLLNAERWDAVSSHAGEAKVIYQKVRIRTSRLTIERAIYRDSTGRRIPRRQPLGLQEEQVRNQFARAGINWDQPLSASSYVNWRSGEQSSKDAIARAGSGLLTLTTTVPSDPEIRQETFTVRENDFHPVGRTIELRNSGTIEIAELNYDALPWSAVNDSLFEPDGAISGVAAPIRPSLSIHLPAPLTDTELDMAELSARLVLDKLHADNGERIELIRTDRGVQVKGIVETDERKQELETQLRFVPHAIPAIFSYREMGGDAPAGTEIASVRMSSVVSQTTPLEKYLVDRGWTGDNVRQISRQIFDSSTAVDRESQAIADLLRRFASKSSLSQTADITLGQLIAEHKSKLLEALTAEEQSLAAVGQTESFKSLPPNSFEVLAADARENVNLTQELISTADPQARSAEVIVPELAKSVAQLRIDLLYVLPSLQLVNNPSPSFRAPNEKP